MNRQLISVVVVLVLVTAGCNQPELRRTSTERWEKRTFRDEGLSLTLPVESKVSHDPSFGVSVWLHPLAPPWLRMEDTQYFVIVTVERKTGRVVEEAREFLTRNVQLTQENEFQFWSAAEHLVVDVRPGEAYSYYRYDVKCTGEDVLQLEAEVRHPVAHGSPKFETEDDALVRRILNSARCL